METNKEKVIKAISGYGLIYSQADELAEKIDKIYNCTVDYSNLQLIKDATRVISDTVKK